MDKWKFTADQFVATQWDTAEQKARFANHFMRFLDSIFKESLFQKWFYTRLSRTFGHIAHFDQEGFYHTFFTSLKGRVDFLEQTLGYSCCGDPTYTYSDVERGLQKAVIEGGYLEKCKNALAEGIKCAELSELARLKAKYEPA